MGLCSSDAGETAAGWILDSKQPRFTLFYTQMAAKFPSPPPPAHSLSFLNSTCFPMRGASPDKRRREQGRDRGKEREDKRERERGREGQWLILQFNYLPALYVILRNLVFGKLVDDLKAIEEHNLTLPDGQETASVADVDRTLDLAESPLLTILGERLGGQKWMVGIEGQVICEGVQPTFSSGLAALFACYYIFNLQYQEGAACTLEFMQRSVKHSIRFPANQFNWIASIRGYRPQSLLLMGGNNLRTLQMALHKDNGPINACENSEEKLYIIGYTESEGYPQC
ncbi:hypothetical protein NFI96_007466 [Prochilodus magdalenae]|nr:hypothetical protein NFI96_007466 [Prochilodus magdalenae]